MKHLSPFPLLFALICSAVSSASPAFAQGFTASMNITPLRLEVPSQNASTQMQIRNRTAAKLDVQLRVFEWRQVEGSDQYAESEDVAISPSIVSIDPRQAQAFHVIALGKRDIKAEKRYRVVIDEIPAEPKANAGAARTTLRLTVPLFVDRDKGAKGTLKVSEKVGAIRFQNTGEQTARLAQISLNSKDGPIALQTNDTLRYIQGGSWVEIALPQELTCNPDPIQVAGLADHQAYDATAEQTCS
ncbi:MAG: fimbria/pilus periplasmic chaperone [Erythrobacter sp.]